MSALSEDRLREVLRDELLSRLPPDNDLPLPWDEEAEELVVAAMLNNEIGAGDLPGLERRHFYRPLNGAVFDLGLALREAGHTVKPPAILGALTEQGFGSRVAEELVRLRNEVPSVALSELREMAGRIVEHSRRRWLLETMAVLDAQLRTSATTHAEACEALRSYLEGSAGG